MSEIVTASDGAQLPIDSLAQTLAYTTIGGNPYLQTVTVVYAGKTYVQTFTYTSTSITSVSQWVKQ